MRQCVRPRSTFQSLDQSDYDMCDPPDSFNVLLDYSTFVISAINLFSIDFLLTCHQDHIYSFINCSKSFVYRFLTSPLTSFLHFYHIFCRIQAEHSTPLPLVTMSYNQNQGNYKYSRGQYDFENTQYDHSQYQQHQDRRQVPQNEHVYGEAYLGSGRSTDQLQSMQPVHQRDSISPRRRSYASQDILNEYHQDNNTLLPPSSDVYETRDSFDQSAGGVYDQQHYTEQYSPLTNNVVLPTTGLNQPAQNLYYQQGDDYYSSSHNSYQQHTESSFNAFPTEPTPQPPQNPFQYQSHHSLYDTSYNPPPLLPYNQEQQHQQDIPLENYDREGFKGGDDEEIEIGDNYHISGDNYEINTFARDLPMPPNGQGLEDHGDIGFGSEEHDHEEDDGADEQRNKIEVGLLNGNLILDCPVPDHILNSYDSSKVDDSREFQFMRYQAATSDPSEFVADRFSLRQRYYKKPRETEMLVVITIYNEPDVLLARTLKGVLANIKHLESRSRSSTWGKDSWKKVVVCIVADGRSKISKTAQALLAGFGVYQEGFARNAVNDKKVVSHIYEYTSMMGISSVGEESVKLAPAKVPVQLLFCLKEENKKKINSHRWALQAFGQVLQPKTVVLLDAGTQPSKDSLYHLWKEFDKDPQVAGTCGEIKAMLGPSYKKLLNPLVAAQNFEYKMSNILDKPMESAFGFISVLPGAFSAYRYVALLNSPNGDGPLAKYFEGEVLHDKQAGIFKANMYLAEDRILCYELVAKKSCSWILKYCRSASAETDVPEEVHDFVSQRRRWLNGSFFAAIYSLVHFSKLFGSSHSAGRKIALFVEFVYQFISLLVSWFSLASFFLVFRILTTALGDLYDPCRYLSVVFLWIYLLSLVSTFIMSFGNTPRGTPKFYLALIIFFAILMIYMIAAAIILAVKAIEEVVDGKTITAKTLFQNRTFRDLVISTLSTYALYFIGSILHLKPWHMITSFFQYLLLSPSYVNVLNIYAFCNLHDISWGTKGATAESLGDAKVTQNGKVEFIDAPITMDEINSLYMKQMSILAREPAPKPEITEESILIEKQKQKGKDDEKNKDYYAFIRSMVVLTWITTNFIIIALVLETGGINYLSKSSTSTTTTVSETLSARSEIFLTVILWIVAFMAAFRLFGTIYYLVNRMAT